MTRIGLQGLRLGAPQTLGALRIVPILRDASTEDLRLARRNLDAIGVVSLDHKGPAVSGTKYLAFVPHGFIVSHTSDGSPVAALGAQFGAPKGEVRGAFVKLIHRMVKREDPVNGTSRVRILPLHLVMEGFLALHFKGPDILWQGYAKHTQRFGLDPRYEKVARGAWAARARGGAPDLRDRPRPGRYPPLRPGGLRLCVRPAASGGLPGRASIRARRLPRPDHRAYGISFPETPSAWAHLDAAGASTVDALAAAVEVVRERWRQYATTLAAGLLERDVDVEIVRTMGRFRLERLLPVLDREEECHIAERIVADDGTLQYLKTFRLSTGQVRRAFLLSKLAQARWRLVDAALFLKTTQRQLAERVVSAGLGYMFTNEALAEAMKTS